ncbi:hypothetical protein Lfu02_41800 [Longispora fulva]|uniref:Uncharacterized protein YjbI with pentapeptide repeats n=1 Tax=Longispora fulva TaxID=619741 RepID=A0A8J7KJ81_9ACTN|nr:pentapeptide repeat-containing protein [Longispora fulva]MBG6136639.1 uncharacterized protein YjbI with pentapeptide repeats [Longispora fulva]GIG59808.1 hypothetical protein Lfu02_41800 [Longispora fulva]
MTTPPVPAPATSALRRRQLMEIRRAVAVAVLAGVALILAMSAVAWWLGGTPTLRREPQISATGVYNLLKLIFAVVAGIGGIVALVVSYRRQQYVEAADERAEAAHILAEAAEQRSAARQLLDQVADERASLASRRDDTRLFNERYARASEQLGSLRPAVRMAGVHAMAGLADDWEHGRQSCVDVLCAYLRIPYSPPSDPTLSPTPPTPEWLARQDEIRAEQQVRYTAIRIIAHRLRPDAETSWQGHSLDFTGATFDGGDFHDAVFSAGRVDFTEATFPAGLTSFEGAQFTGATVSFSRAQFTGATLLFTGAAFLAADTTFDGARFSRGRVMFDHARVEAGLVFDRADLDDCLLSFTALTVAAGSVSFAATRVNGGTVHFQDAEIAGQGRMAFHSTDFSGGTVTFANTGFLGGDTSFQGSSFTGCVVTLAGARFAGGRVTFDGIRIHPGPAPRLDASIVAAPPPGLELGPMLTVTPSTPGTSPE